MADVSEEKVVRKMPYDAKAEKSVIAGLIIDSQKINLVQEILPSGELFYNRAYGEIYDTILEMNRQMRGIDPITLHDKLLEKDIPPEASSVEALSQMILDVPTAANVDQYAIVVQEKATLRDLIRVTEGIANDCYNRKSDINELLEDTEKKIFKIVQRRNLGEFVPIDQVVMDSLDIIEKAAKTTGDVTGLPSGFIDLDHKTAGFQPGNLVLIAARPAMGKTSFVLSLAKNVVVNQNKPIVMFSLEMSKTELVNRLLSMDSRVDSQKFKTGQLNEGDWESLIESGGNIGNSPLILDDTSTNLAEIRSKCRKYRAEKNIELVIIDYLQLMNGNGKESRQQEISEISRGLKLMAKELGIPVIALSQLSRQVEQRPDHRPMLSDLRESGAIEQDADMVLFIYRDEVYNPDNPDNKNKAEIIIAKQRSGPIGTVNLAWLPEFTQFGNLAR